MTGSARCGDEEREIYRRLGGAHGRSVQMATRFRTRQSLGRVEDRVEDDHALRAWRNWPARENVSRAYSRHTADQSPFRRRIYCCQLRDLFSFFYLSAFSSSLLFSFSLSLCPLIAFSLISFDEREVRKKAWWCICVRDRWGEGFAVRFANRFRRVESVALDPRRDMSY